MSEQTERVEFGLVGSIRQNAEIQAQYSTSRSMLAQSASWPFLAPKH